MKSSRPTGFTCLGVWTVISILLTEIPHVNAGDSESLGGTIGIVIAVSLFTSLITTASTLGILYCIHKSRKKSSRLKRDPSTRASILSSVPPSDRSDECTQPLTGRYIRQQSTVSGASSVNGDLRRSRVKSDFIAKWCTGNNLTEKTAEVLRDHGFTYKEAVEAMDVNDVASLGLSRAQECVLRQVLNLRQRNGSGSSYISRNPNRANSDEALPLTSINSHNSSKGSGSVFERTQSMDDVDGAVTRTLQPTIMKKRSMGSNMDIIEDTTGESTIIIRSTKTVVHDNNPALIHYTRHIDSKGNTRKFNGLLSDKGLWELARMIGVEWPRLATYLNVPSSVQAQIKMDYPNNTLQQIYSVFKIWRDTTEGSKQQVKGILYNALCKCERSDLGEDILREETQGSEERVGYHSII